jgi:plastocyanin
LRRARRLVIACSIAATVGFSAAGAPARAAVTTPDVTVFAAAFTYVAGDDSIHDLVTTDTLVVPHGQKLGFANLDSAGHNITADAGPSGDTAFQSATVTVTDTLRMNAPVDVVGVSLLAPGRYGFHCAVHPVMHGVLVVQ